MLQFESCFVNGDWHLRQSQQMHIYGVHKIPFFLREGCKSRLIDASVFVFICTVITNNRSPVRRSADTENHQLYTYHISQMGNL